MAMTKCAECGAKISTLAKACPKCGAEQRLSGAQSIAPPRPKSSKRWLWWALGIVFLGSIAARVAVPGVPKEPGSATSPRSLPAPLSTEAKARKDQRDLAQAAGLMAARKLKAAAKDPRSFELVSAIQVPGDAVCFTYRATNSFNATLQNSAVMVPGKTPSILIEGQHQAFVASWNKHCTQAGGEDLGSIYNRLGLDG